MLGRWIATDGLMGKCSESYPLIQAAKYLGVPPWELMKQSVYWRIKALTAMKAEYNAQKILENKNKGK